MTNNEKKLLVSNQRIEKLKEGGGVEALKKQKDSGKMTARERIDALLDKNSFRN